MYKELANYGLSPFPVSDGTGNKAVKQPLVRWKQFQEEPAEPEEIARWEDCYPSTFVGIACGKGSGGLEVLDFDIPGKAEGTAGEPPAYEPWLQLLIQHGQGTLVEKLVKYKTRSGGMQVAYRCPGLTDGSQKLARRHKDVLIETRGIGGYVVCPPSHGYKFTDGDFSRLPELTLDERNLLIEAARVLDETETPEDNVWEPIPIRTGGAGIKPGVDYNSRHSISEVLEPLGWKQGRRWGRKVYWTRPGKAVTEGTSAWSDDTHLWVFTTSTNLPTEKQLTPFSIFAHAYHDGNFSEAAKALARQGYGVAQAGDNEESRKQSYAIAGPDEDLSCARYNHTDAGNAKRFIDKYGSRIRYCHVWSKWLVWDGRRWSMDEKGGAEVCDLYLKMIAELAAEAARCSDPSARNALNAWALKCEGRAKMDNCLAVVKSSLQMAVEPGQLDADWWLLNCLNGTINLITGDLQPHDPLDLITRMCPVDYDCEAQCPLWETFLTRVLPCEELRRFVHKAIGYSLTGHTGEQCFFFLHGSHGANGKSTFMEVTQDVLGGYSKAMQPDTLMLSPVGRSGPSPDIARLKGCRFVSAPETSAGRRLDEQLVKQLTGGDRIVARNLYQDQFEFTPELKLWITGNHKPMIQGTDNAIWRRVRLISFSVVIPEEERDLNMKAKLIAESPGILRWMVRGCLDWQKEGLKAPGEVLASVREYREEMDTLGAFLLEKCIAEESSSVGSTQLYKAFSDWASSNGEKPWKQKAFSLALLERGIVRQRLSKGSAFCGLKLDTP